MDGAPIDWRKDFFLTAPGADLASESEVGPFQQIFQSAAEASIPALNFHGNPRFLPEQQDEIDFVPHYVPEISQLHGLPEYVFQVMAEAEEVNRH
jgi:hypothetical protein